MPKTAAGDIPGCFRFCGNNAKLNMTPRSGAGRMLMKKRLISLLLCLCMVLTLLPAAVLAEGPAGNAGSSTVKKVTYLDANGVEQTVSATAAPTDVDESGTIRTWGKSGETSWYYFDGTTRMSGYLRVIDNVHLILCDGADLTVSMGIQIDENKNLTIYAQSAGENAGKLTANGVGLGSSAIGIGGEGTLTINGGVIEAACSEIEGDFVISCGIAADTTINGGKVTAVGGGAYGSFGCKSLGVSGSLTFNGGTLLAKSSRVTGGGGRAQAIDGQPTLPTGDYCWRTAAGVNYTKNSYNAGNAAYVELTTQPNGGGYLSYMGWNDDTKKLESRLLADGEYTVLTGDMTELGTSGTETWYVVKDDVTITGGNADNVLLILGHVNLILCDGATLTISNPTEPYVVQLIQILPDNSSLTIYGQSGQTGKLEVSAAHGTFAAFGIYCGGPMTVHGGVVEVRNGSSGDESFCIENLDWLTIHSGTIRLSGQKTFHYSDFIRLPETYWWRTTDSAKYLPSSREAYTVGSETYLELTTRKPADSQIDQIAYQTWNAETGQLEDAFCYGGTKVTANTGAVTWGESGKTTWYYVDEDATIGGEALVKGTVHLILCDNATLTVQDGVNGENGAELYVYAQREESETGRAVGKLRVTKSESTRICTGIIIEKLTVNGGEITVEATNGGNSEVHGVHVHALTVNSGTLNAAGRQTVAGSGENGVKCGITVLESMTVNGGKVTAEGSALTPQDGKEGNSYGILLQGTMTVNGGTLITRAASGKGAIGMESGELTLPTTCWWRSSDAEATPYQTKNTYTNDALGASYFELVTTKPEIVSAGKVKYLDWDSTNSRLTQKECAAPLALEDSEESVTLSSGWYAVSGTQTIEGTLCIDEGAKVHLILCDNAELNAAGGIYGEGSLSIYAQREQSEPGKAVGKLNVDAEYYDEWNGYYSIQGIWLDDSSEALTVNGGEITIHAPQTLREDMDSYSVYGVRVPGAVIVNGGKLTTEAKTGGYTIEDVEAETDGIGCGTMTIRGGAVNAAASDFTSSGKWYSCISCGLRVISELSMTGGSLTATAGNASNPESIEVCSYGVQVDGNMTCNGGSVTATGGNVRSKLGSSYGIWVRNLTVTKDTVTATSGIALASTDIAINAVYDAQTETYTEGVFTLSGGTVKSAREGGALGVQCQGSDSNKTVVSGGTMKLFVGDFRTLEVSNGVTLNSLLADGYYFGYDKKEESEGVSRLTSASVLPLPIQSASISADKTSLTYNETVTVTATVVKREGISEEPTYAWYDGETLLTDATGASLRTNTLTAGTHKIKCVVTLSPSVVTTNEVTITVSAASLTGVSAEQTGALTYNGQPQTATVETTATAVNGQSVAFTYSTAEDGTYSETVPAFTSGTHTVYYKATAANHETASGRFSVTIGKKDVVLRALDQEAYIGSAPDFTKPVAGENYTIDGIVSGDVLEGVTVTLACDGDLKKAGSYEIVLRAAGEDPRYSYTTENGTLTIKTQPSELGSTVDLPDRTPGGSVTTDRADAAVGSTVTITVKPEDGYRLKDLTVTDRDGNEIELTSLGGGKYSFRMPSGGAKISAEFAKKPLMRFRDVTGDDWFHDDVAYACENGLMNGTGEETFDPHAPTSRGMLVTILHRLEGEPKAAAKQAFGDVHANGYYANAVLWAAAEGLVSGYSQTQFGPDDAITREQLAVILYRYALKKGLIEKAPEADLTQFADSGRISSYAVTAMRWAVETGLLQGADGKLDPQGHATRAQLAAVLRRFCER